MCRLALMNNEGIKHIEENYGLENLFNHLEKQLGGHGNGICFIYKDGSYFIRKGVHLTNEEIAEEVLMKLKHIKWIIYHTRLASIGSISDKNCHPFNNNGRILAMNGTERNCTIIDKSLTDTENILITTKNITKDTREYRSVFLGYENGKVFANKNCGRLEYIPCENGGRVFASSFPIRCYMEDMVYEAPEYFVEGTKMNPLESAEPNKHYAYKQHYR